MRILYIQPFSGASGDMLLGALVDAGLSIDRLRDGPYLRLLRLAIRERYITALLFTGLLGAWLAAVLLIPRVKALDTRHGLLSYPDVLRHRIITNFSAEAEGITPDRIVDMLIEAVLVDDSDTELARAICNGYHLGGAYSIEWSFGSSRQPAMSRCRCADR